MWKVFHFFWIKSKICFTLSATIRKCFNFSSKLGKVFHFFRFYVNCASHFSHECKKCVAFFKQNAKSVSPFFRQNSKTFSVFFWQDAKKCFTFFPTKNEKKNSLFFDKMRKTIRYLLLVYIFSIGFFSNRCWKIVQDCILNKNFIKWNCQKTVENHKSEKWFSMFGWI